MRRLLGYTVLQLTVPAAGDGVFSVQEEGFIKLVDLKNNKTTTNLVNMLDVKREDGEPITDWADWQLSADMKYILVKTDYVKVRGVHTLITLKLTDA